MCVKDQLNEYLPALFQIIHGIEATGLLDVIRKSPEVWIPVFESGNNFNISPDEFLDQLVPHYSEYQSQKMAEIDCFKYFSDVVQEENGMCFHY